MSKKYTRILENQAKFLPRSKNFKETKLTNVSVDDALDFYDSKEWHQCRKNFITDKELKCIACGIDLELYPEMLNVDHILPLRYYWERRLDNNNLQILCCECNKEKGNRIVEDMKEIGREVKSQRKSYGLNRFSNLT